MRNHINASGQPVDANFVADAERRRRDDTAAGVPDGKKSIVMLVRWS
jgi:hypothetical protein